MDSLVAPKLNRAPQVSEIRCASAITSGAQASYLWRTSMCATDKSSYLWRPSCAPQIAITTDVSLVAHRLGATDNPNMCVTGRLFCTSVEEA